MNQIYGNANVFMKVKAQTGRQADKAKSLTKFNGAEKKKIKSIRLIFITKFSICFIYKEAFYYSMFLHFSALKTI